MNILRVLLPKSGVSFLEDSATIRNGLEKMRYHGFSAVPVINKEGVYVGTITEGDFLWYLIDAGADWNLKQQESVRIRDIIRKDRGKPVTVNASMEELLHLAREQNFAPVTDDRGVFVGMVTRGDIMRWFEQELISVPNTGTAE